MSRYKQDLDSKLFAKTWEGQQWKITVSVHSYKGMAPKMRLSREKANPKYHRSASDLGYLTREETEGLLPILQEALLHMRKG